MPDQKTSQLAQITASGVADNDLLYLVDVSAGTSGSKGILVSEARSLMQSNLGLVIPFAWGDATPKIIGTVLTGRTIFNARIIIQTAFNGTGAALSLGTNVLPSQLMTTSQNDPSTPAEYITSPNITYGSDTVIQLTITPGTGASQGSGFVILETYT